MRKSECIFEEGWHSRILRVPKKVRLETDGPVLEVKFDEEKCAYVDDPDDGKPTYLIYA